MTLHAADFTFVMDPENHTYSAHWYPSTSQGFSPLNAVDKQARFRVDIYRGGGFNGYYFTDQDVTIEHSKRMIELFLKNEPLPDNIYSFKNFNY